MIGSQCLSAFARTPRKLNTSGKVKVLVGEGLTNHPYRKSGGPFGDHETATGYPRGNPERNWKIYYASFRRVNTIPSNHNRLAASILEYMARVQEIQASLEPEENSPVVEEDEHRDIPN